jgi:pyrimidine operon attenuation protein/uracil phosphoribosyltransferase
VLVDRGRREYPIQADYVGIHVTEIDPAHKIIVQLKPDDAQDAVFME